MSLGEQLPPFWLTVSHSRQYGQSKRRELLTRTHHHSPEHIITHQTHNHSPEHIITHQTHHHSPEHNPSPEHITSHQNTSSLTRHIITHQNTSLTRHHHSPEHITTHQNTPLTSPEHITTHQNTSLTRPHHHSPDTSQLTRTHHCSPEHINHLTHHHSPDTSPHTRTHHYSPEHNTTHQNTCTFSITAVINPNFPFSCFPYRTQTFRYNSIHIPSETKPAIHLVFSSFFAHLYPKCCWQKYYVGCGRTNGQPSFDSRSPRSRFISYVQRSERPLGPPRPLCNGYWW